MLPNTRVLHLKRKNTILVLRTLKQVLPQDRSARAAQTGSSLAAARHPVQTLRLPEGARRLPQAPARLLLRNHQEPTQGVPGEQEEQGPGGHRGRSNG